MVTSAQIDKAVEILVREASPEKIILFGSHSRGENRPDSDVDFLVIEPEPVDRHKEMVRLRRALSPMRIPVDIVVKGAHMVREWGEVPGSFLYNALREGRMVYEKRCRLRVVTL
jgi:predicted nucleotidyltransferase